MSRLLDCGGRVLDLDRTRVMGVLNVTPDSFSDGGYFFERDAAIARAREMVAEGADIIDVGGESTRPGSAPVSEAEELDRVVPVIEALSREVDLPLSVDTSKAAVMREAAAVGAGLVNDVRALQAEGALEAVREARLPVCLMHMRGSPDSMQDAPRYDDVVAEVRAFLNQRVAACEAAGLARETLLVDPGFGFGKTLAHNLALLKHLDMLVADGLPVLVGFSRKSMFGQLLGRPVDGRLAGGLALAVLAVGKGASIIRTHDVAATVDAVKVVEAVMGGEQGGD